MVALTLIGSVAKSALVGAVATKIVDSFISTKINTKVEKNKWERNTKIELFSNMCEDIIMINKKNLSDSIIKLKKTSAKVSLLIHDRTLSTKIESYILKLQKIDSNELEMDLDTLNNKMMSYLRNDIRKSH